MNNLFKYSILICPILVFIDVKIPITSSINVGIKEGLFLFIGIYLCNARTAKWAWQNIIVRGILLYFLFTLLDNIFLNNMKNATISLLRTAEGILLLVGVLRFLRQHHINLLYKSIIISAVILSFQTLLIYLFHIEVDKTVGGIAGIWLSIATFIIYFNYRSINWNNKLLVAIFLLLLVANYYSDKRTWLFITIFLLAIDQLRRLSQLKIILILSGFALCLLLFEPLQSVIIKNERIYELISALGKFDLTEVSAFSTRMVRWGNVLTDLNKAWFWGVGFENIDLGLPPWVTDYHPDNQYLEIWLHSGLPALLCFCFVLYKGAFMKDKTGSAHILSTKAIFFLFIIGGITWGYINGFGILITLYIFGIAAYCAEYAKYRNMSSAVKSVVTQTTAV